MATTTNLGVTLVEASQSQKEITINQALICLDAMILARVRLSAVSSYYFYV